VHTWEAKITYVNYFIDCTHNLTSSKIFASQHGHGGQETIQPDCLQTCSDIWNK